jgi:hypothetical protein
MKNTLCKAGAIFSFVLLAASSSPAVVLFSQPFNGANYYYSDGLPGYAKVYDDFILGGGGTISKVDWSGLDPNNDLTGFTINIFSDNSGSPGTSLSSSVITGNAGETPSGTLTINNYSATLPTAFTASPGTEYYIQIVGTASGAGGFYWETSSQGNDGALSDLFTVSPMNNNLAFTLEGTPEPTTIVLGLLGAITFLVRRPSTKS